MTKNHAIFFIAMALTMLTIIAVGPVPFWTGFAIGTFWGAFTGGAFILLEL